MNLMTKSNLMTALIAVGAVAIAMRVNADVANFILNTDNDYFLD